MIPLILDILILATLVFFAFQGHRRGLVLTLCSLVAVMVALVGAGILSDALAPKVADAIEPRLEQAIAEELESALRHNEFTGVNGDVASSPEEISLPGVLAVLRENKLYQGFMDSVEKALDAGISTAAASASARVAAAIARQVARGILFPVCFLLLLILWNLLSHALDLVSKLPVLDGLNRTLGGVAGLVKGLLIVYIAAWVLCTLTVFIKPETVEQTRLLLFLTQHSPLDLLMLV